jgi:hypothetical protein
MVWDSPGLLGELVVGTEELHMELVGLSLEASAAAAGLGEMVATNKVPPPTIAVVAVEAD